MLLSLSPPWCYSAVVWPPFFSCMCHVMALFLDSGSRGRCFVLSEVTGGRRCACRGGTPVWENNWQTQSEVRDMKLYTLAKSVFFSQKVTILYLSPFLVYVSSYLLTLWRKCWLASVPFISVSCQTLPLPDRNVKDMCKNIVTLHETGVMTLVNWSKF